MGSLTIRQFNALVSRNNELTARLALHAGTIAAAIYNVNRTDAEQPFLQAWDIFADVKRPSEETAATPEPPRSDPKALFERLKLAMGSKPARPKIIEHEAVPA